jgi:hypothetical protein
MAGRDAGSYKQNPATYVLKLSDDNDRPQATIMDDIVNVPQTNQLSSASTAHPRTMSNAMKVGKQNEARAPDNICCKRDKG